MRASFAVCVLLVGVVTLSLAQAPAPTSAPPAPPPASSSTDTNFNGESASSSTNSSEALILQQLVEKIERLETRALEQDPAQIEVLRERLNKAEAKLFQAESRLETVRETEATSRATLFWVVFVVVFLAFAAIVGLVTFSVYTLRRITQLGEPIFDNFHKPHLPMAHGGHVALPHPSQPAETPSAGPLAPLAAVGSAPASVGETRLLDAVGRLERKIEEIEKAAHHDNHVHGPLGVANGQPDEMLQNHRSSDRLALLVSKGEALTHLGQFEKAIGCLEEAIAFAPADPTPMVKKGYALEKIGRLEEAVRCYDRAIELDPHHSMAYLLKGSVYNRLQKYAEAIECYDRALSTKNEQQNPDGGS